MNVSSPQMQLLDYERNQDTARHLGVFLNAI